MKYINNRIILNTFSHSNNIISRTRLTLKMHTTTTTATKNSAGGTRGLQQDEQNTTVGDT
jgi:hypothetical protein